MAWNGNGYGSNSSGGRGGSGGRSGGNQARQDPRLPATAPYNFIPWFKDKTTKALPEGERGELMSGTITCTLKALTPLLVGDAQARKDGGDDKEPTSRHFMKVDGRYVIPGSSLKGMLRSFMETIANAHLSPVGRNRMFWRNVAGNGNAAYKGLFANDRDDIQGGYLVKNGADVTLYPVHVSSDATSQDPKAYCTGQMYDRKAGGMKQKAYMFGAFDRDGESLPVSDEVFDDFMAQMTDGQRKIWKDEEKRFNNGKPARVFFRDNRDRRPDEKREVRGLGVCRYFRIPYRKTVADIVGPCPDDDFVRNLFGSVDGKDAVKGRVRIEAAVFEGNPKEAEPVLTVLGQPHATCVTHYLDQPHAKIGKNLFDTLDNYDTSEALRGRKHYWHRWRQPGLDPVAPPKDNMKVASRLYPLAYGSKAAFVVHLDRVDAVELGAVLEALDLPKGHAHKLGTGRSIGLGSVRIDVKSVNVGRVADRYASLAARFSGKEPLMPEDRQAACRKAFRDHVRKAVGEDSFESLSEAVNAMTDFDHRPPIERTATMPLNDKTGRVATFKNKPLLQKVMDVFKGNVVAKGK